VWLVIPLIASCSTRCRRYGGKRPPGFVPFSVTPQPPQWWFRPHGDGIRRPSGALHATRCCLEAPVVHVVMTDIQQFIQQYALEGEAKASRGSPSSSAKSSNSKKRQNRLLPFAGRKGRKTSGTKDKDRVRNLVEVCRLLQEVLLAFGDFPPSSSVPAGISTITLLHALIAAHSTLPPSCARTIHIRSARRRPPALSAIVISTALHRGTHLSTRSCIPGRCPTTPPWVASRTFWVTEAGIHVDPLSFIPRSFASVKRSADYPPVHLYISLSCCHA